MDRRYSCALLLVVLAGCVLILGCHGSGTTLPSVFTTSLPGGTVNTPYSTMLEVVGGTPPYTWSQVSGGAMPPGITASSAGVIGGTPTQAGTFGPYVFKVEDANNNISESTSMSIKITASSLSVTTTSLPNGVVGTSYSATLAATSGTAPYSWAETSGGALPAGLFLSSSGVISGTPTTAGSYGPYVFTVTDSSSTTAQSGQLTITVTGTPVAVCTALGNEAALASGTPYGFLLKGTDSSGNPIYIAGSFTPNGTGGITAAAADYNGISDGPQSLQVNLANSSYAFGPQAQGCLYLAFSGLASTQASEKQPPAASHVVPVVAIGARKIKKPNTVAVPVSSVQFSFYLSGFDGTVYNTGRIIESDTKATKTSAAGFIHLQTPADFALAELQTNYAFGVDGWTSTAPGLLRTAMAGTFTNTAGTLSAGYADIDAGGTASGEQTGGYGTLTNTTIDTTTGRGTGSFFTTSTTGPLTFDFVFYILNGSDLILLSTDLATGSNTPLLVGRALVSSATYPATPLSGYYLLASQGLQSTGTAIGNIAEIGTLNATSSGTIPTATIYSNLAGTYAMNQYPASTYTVEAASGRTVLNGVDFSSPVVYLTASTADDAIAGFLVGTDPQSSSGAMVLQTATTSGFSTAGISGYYAASSAEDVDGLNGAFLGGFNFNGTTGAYTLLSSLTTGTLTNVPTASSFLVNTDGSGNLQGGKFPFVTNGTVLFAIPDSGDPLLFVFTEGTLPQP
jgi:large repetitive protein